MRLTTVVSTLSLLASAFAHSHHPQYDERDILEERQSSVVVTTGAPGTAVYPRLEIRQMLNTQSNQWQLLILALQQWQNTSQSLSTSYYQIAGIHGIPRTNYNGVGQCSSCGNTDGYCPHDSVLFPGWHRAYVAHFEQQFLAVVNSIAAQYPSNNRAAFQQAASTMRWPYWDWAARPASGMPNFAKVISQTKVTVLGPKGYVTVNNPLYQYSFQDTSQLYYYPFTGWPSTFRYPSTNAKTAFSQEDMATSAFDNIRANMQDQVYQLMTTCTDFLHFSNDDAGSSSTSCSNSLEGIHNTIHNTAGGPGNSSVVGGHMTYLPTAAFDPVFFLHHANVDRLFAMWQTINGGSYGASQQAPHNTWTIASGSTQNADSPLTPFYKDTKGNFWTTNQVRKWNTTFHYTYPEFSNSDGSRAAIISYVNKLYGPSATATAGSSKRTAEAEPEAWADAEPADVPEAPVLEERQAATMLKASNGSLYQYVANIKTPRYALNGSYNIFLFHGLPTTEDPSSWILDPHLIGPMGVMAQADMMMGMTQSLIAAGSVPLTRTLTNMALYGGLPDLSETSVVPYLQKNLEWRVAGPDGLAVDPGTIDGFEVSVVSSTATDPRDPTVLPVYSPFTTLVKITQGFSGGLNETDTANARLV